MTCPDEGLLLALAERRLPADQRAALDTHLDSCASCLELAVHAARFAGGDATTGTASERYELGPEIARGGMGRIFSAHDHVLGREVAIKCMREDRVGLERRFAREAALTARLQHPAIVPIHDSGRLRDGRAFYAMRRIGGKPLDRLASEAPDLRARLALVVHVIAVVDAIAYVHSEGVIHRDLKPHNVLVGEFGETVLVDWGLAKQLGDRDSDVQAAGASPVDASMTVDGTVMGTRGYIAPEQRAGQVVDARADVYGLGATLRHVITGRPPEPVSPSDLAGVAPELVAIVERAMAADPAQRYASAKQLADDLHRFQTGRLVEAHRYSASQLVRRWLRRHRAIAAVSIAALGAIAIVAGVAIDRTVTARQVAERQRDAAHALVAFSIGDLRDKLDAVGRLDALSGVADAVIRYYDQLDREIGANGVDPLDRAVAFGIVADVDRSRGDVAAGLAASRHSLELARAAFAQHPGADEEAELGRGLSQVVELARATGQAEPAVLAEADAIAHRNADRGGPWTDLVGNVDVEVGLASIAAGDEVRARHAFEDAIAAGKRLESVDARAGTRRITAAANELATMSLKSGDLDVASTAAETALAAAQRATARDPKDNAAQHELVVAWERTSDVRKQRHDDAGQLAALGEELRIQTALSALDPQNVDWNRGLGALEERLGLLAEARGELSAALAHFTASRDVSAKLVAITDASQVPDLRFVTDLGTSDLDLGDFFSGRGQLDKARAAYERALASYTRVDRAEHTAESRRAIVMISAHLGDLEHASHHDAAARAVLEQGIALGEQVLVASDTPYDRVVLASNLMILADADPARAASLLARALAVVQPLRSLTSLDQNTRDVIVDLDAAVAHRSAR